MGLNADHRSSGARGGFRPLVRYGQRRAAQERTDAREPADRQLQVMDDEPAAMYRFRRQQTLASPALIEGVGYWSGEQVRVECRPASPDSGVVFVRSDLPDRPRIPALADYRVDAARRTVLQNGSARVEMVEHLLAALAGLQIDNCEVWIDRAELPGCDGSAKPFVEAFDAAGIVPQSAPRAARFVAKPLRLCRDGSWIEALPSPDGRTTLHYVLDYGIGGPIGRQELEVSLKPRRFREGLAPSRTFLLAAEAEALRAQGLAGRTTARDLLVFGPHGPIDNQLRFPDECVRHKLLDLVGDLALAGTDLVGRFRAYRSGHKLNAELVRQLTAELELAADVRHAA